MRELTPVVKNKIEKSCIEWFGNNYIQCFFVRVYGPSINVFVDLQENQKIPMDGYWDLFEWCREQGYNSVDIFPSVKSTSSDCIEMNNVFVMASHLLEIWSKDDRVQDSTIVNTQEKLCIYVCMEEEFMAEFTRAYRALPWQISNLIEWFTFFPEHFEQVKAEVKALE